MFDQLTILAPGLLGASVARGARKHGLARRIVVWARRAEVRAELAGQDWCDATAETPEAAASEASLVVLAPPVDRIVELAGSIAPHLRDGAIVTDVGSVKTAIAEGAAGFFRAGTHFIPSHPMAGSDKTGWEHGSAELFEKRVCFVTPEPRTAPAALAALNGFWKALGMTTVELSPRDHDEIVAHISHLPQLLASSLCAFLAEKNVGWRDYAGGGLRDTTRIAGSDPAIWGAIFEQNREQVLAALRDYQAELAAFTRALEDKNFDELAARMARGREYRKGFKI